MFTDKILDKVINRIQSKLISYSKITLDNPTPTQLRESLIVLVKKLLNNTLTHDLEGYTTKVIRNMDTSDKLTKSLITFFLTNIKTNKSLFMLVINTTAKDLNDTRENMVISGLRLISNLDHEEIIVYFTSTIHKLMLDKRNTVQQAAILTSLSLYEKNRTKFFESKFDHQLMRCMETENVNIRETTLFVISCTDISINIDNILRNLQLSLVEKESILRLIRKKLENTDEISFADNCSNSSIFNEKEKGSIDENDSHDEQSVWAEPPHNNINHQKYIIVDKKKKLHNIIGKTQKKFILTCLRSENPSLSILASMILIKCPVYHNLIFSSLIHFLDTIYAIEILQFLYFENLCFDSRMFLMFSSDSEEIKKYKLLSLTQIMDKLARMEIKQYFLCHKIEIIEKLISENYDGKYVKELVRIALNHEYSSKLLKNKECDNCTKQEYKCDEMTILQLLARIKNKLNFRIEDMIPNHPYIVDVKPIIILLRQQEIIHNIDIFLNHLKFLNLQFDDFNELMNYTTICLTKKQIHSIFIDDSLNWPKELRIKIQMIKNFVEKNPNNISIISHEKKVKKLNANQYEKHDHNTVHHMYYENKSASNTKIVSINNEMTESSQTILSKTSPSKEDYRFESKTDSLSLNSQIYNSQCDLKDNDQIEEEMKKLGFNSTQSNECIQQNIDKKILESLKCNNQVFESESTKKHTDLTICLKEVSSKKNKNQLPNNKIIYENQKEIKNQKMEMENQNKAEQTSTIEQKNTDLADISSDHDTSQGDIHFSLISNSYFTGRIYLHKNHLYLDVQFLKIKFMFSYNNKIKMIQIPQKIKIKTIEEADLNKSINIKINKTFYKITLSIEKFIFPNVVSNDEFIENFTKLTEFEMIKTNAIQKMNVYHIDKNKFSFSIRKKTFYGEIFNNQVIIKGCNKKMLKMLKSI